MDDRQDLPAWMHYADINMNTAREKVRVAKCLENLPLINEAFKNAEVSYSKVRAMTRVTYRDVLIPWAQDAQER